MLWPSISRWKFQRRPHRQVAGQRLVLEHGLEQDQQRAGEQHAGQQQQGAALLRPQLRWRHLAEPVDDAAEHAEQQRFEHAGRCGEEDQRGDRQPRAAGTRPDEGEETVRRRRGGLGRIRVEQLFEQAQHVALRRTRAASLADADASRSAGAAMLQPGTRR